jgi:hypothetical protein
MKFTPVRIELNPMMNAASVIGMTEDGEPTPPSAGSELEYGV